MKFSLSIKKLYFALFLTAVSLPSAAQIENQDIDPEELPFGLLDEANQPDEENFIDNNYLGPLDQDVELDDKNPFFPDEYYVERLKAIPAPEELQTFNPVVKNYIDRYAGRLRRSVSSLVGRYNLYANIFDDILARYDLPEVLNYLPVIESAINPKAKSHAGAAGLWQFMPSTGKNYGLDINTWVDERNDPWLSTEAAARYLSKLYETYGDWCLVLAAYNCGPGNVNRAIARAGGISDYWTIYPYLPKETRGYVPAFIAATYIMNNYSQHNIKARTATKPIVLDTATVHYDIKMEQIATACGIDLEEIKGFNPQYRSTFIPGARRRCTIALPQELSIKFAAVEDSIYRYNAANNPTTAVADSTNNTTAENIGDIANNDSSDDYETYINTSSNHNKKSSQSRKSKKTSSSSRKGKTVTARSGDSLSRIAARNNTTVAKLRKLNRIKGDRIRAGQKIRVK